MAEARTGRILLVAPTFHGYWDSIAAPLRAAGHEVVPHLYDRHGSALAKARTKWHELRERSAPGSGRRAARRAATRAALAAVREADPDRVLVIKGDVLDSPFWEELDRRRVPRALWLWDEFRRNDFTLDQLRFAVGDGTLLSYSREDLAWLGARGFAPRYSPNGFDDRYSAHGSASGEVIFIGARYPNRERLLVALHSAGVPVRAVGRDWSHHWFDRLRTWNSPRPDLPWSRDVDRQQGYHLLAGSAAAVNVHSDQDGFSMRTFEVPGCGALQLIDRTDVGEFYEPGREVLVFESEAELVDQCQRAAREPEWARSIGAAGRERTLAEHTFTKRLRALGDLWA